jgi:glycosyltransferase involved in cell wall biosynthesis
MTRVVFAIPGDLQARTGGYGYDRRVLAALPSFGVEAVHCALPGGFPHPSPAAVAESVAAMRAALRPGDVALIDGLAFGALPESALIEIGAPIVALCHHPLCLETGLAPERSAALRESERRALALAAHMVVTSPHTGALLTREFAAPREKISVAVPGTDPVPRARGSNGAPALLAVGSIIPRKAFDLLVEALAGLAGLDWRLRIVGGDTPSPQTARALDALIAAKDLASRIERAGELADEPLGELFDASDVFVSASLYEGFGMALAEALARGLPIVTTTGGAAAETIPDAAALKIPPGDVHALREALRRLISDASLRLQLADASWRAGQGLPRWEDAARILAEAVQRVAGARR